MIVGLGLLVMITGLILDNTGLESKKLSVNVVSKTEFVEGSGKAEMMQYKEGAVDENVIPEIKVFPKEIKLPIYDKSSDLDSADVYFVLTTKPVDGEPVKMTFGQKSGSKDIYLTGKSVFEFDESNWDIPQKTTIKVKHNLKNAAEARFDAKAGNVSLAWSLSIGTLAFLFLLLALYHRFLLPFPKSDVSAEKGEKGSYGGILTSFFKIKGILPAIAFILLYRFAESQLTKMASPFLLDARENGGLAMSLTEKGFAYGTVGVLSLVIGGILGGVLAARHGLKKWIWWMAIAINLPNIVYIYMALVQPAELVTINTMIAIEQFGYGFGFTGYMLYMLYLVSESKFKTAHFAIATGFMALGMMLPGMISGWVQEQLGYSNFFIYVIICTIPSFIALWFVNRTLDPSFGLKKED